LRQPGWPLPSGSDTATSGSSDGAATGLTASPAACARRTGTSQHALKCVAPDERGGHTERAGTPTEKGQPHLAGRLLRLAYLSQAMTLARLLVLVETPDPEQQEGRGWIPRPPKIASASDFIVVIFAVTIATILVLLTIGVMVAGIFGADIKSYFAIITSIITSMISALVGYLAGKGQGRIETEKEIKQLEPPS
jgi:hypothetical protein